MEPGGDETTTSDSKPSHSKRSTQLDVQNPMSEPQAKRVRTEETTIEVTDRPPAEEQHPSHYQQQDEQGSRPPSQKNPDQSQQQRNSVLESDQSQQQQQQQQQQGNSLLQSLVLYGQQQPGSMTALQGQPWPLGLQFPGLVLNPALQPGAYASVGTDPRFLVQPQMIGGLPIAYQAMALGSNQLLQNPSSEAANALVGVAFPGLVGAPSVAGLQSSAEQRSSQEQGPAALEPGLSGHKPVLLYMTCDDDSLSEYQCMVRKQIELFEATREDAESNAQGRNRPILMGQVGVRCRHCTFLLPKHRARGAVYYPAKLEGVYQAAQNMASGHLCEHCPHIPEQLRDELSKLRERKSSAGGGKKYWADGVRVLGVCEDGDVLRFKKR